VVGFVLGKPPQSELTLIEHAMEQAQAVLPPLLKGEFDVAMMQLHRSNRSEPVKPQAKARPTGGESNATG
jgi:PTH1 family peptidyl-tRNA hydrolase